MRSEAHSLSYWFIPASSFAGAALFIVFAVSLIMQIVAGHGSVAGNLLRIAVAIVFLFVGLFLAAFGTLYRMSFDDPRET